MYSMGTGTSLKRAIRCLNLFYLGLGIIDSVSSLSFSAFFSKFFTQNT